MYASNKWKEKSVLREIDEKTFNPERNRILSLTKTFISLPSLHTVLICINITADKADAQALLWEGLEVPTCRSSLQPVQVGVPQQWDDDIYTKPGCFFT